MKRKSYIVAFLLISGYLFYPSCKKETNDISPTIGFKADSCYIYSDTTIAVGELMKFGIIANKGGTNLTNLVIKVNTGIEYIYLDTGFNSASLNCKKNIIKGINSNEKWTFTIMDKNRNRSSISLTVKKDTSSVFGNIINYPSITLGAQNNINRGGFLCLTDTSVYFLDQAFINQEKIDVVYYYGDDENTIASPGANFEATVFSGSNGTDNWSIRRETRYILTTASTTDFDIVSNDSMMIVLYDEPSAKRKAKNLAVGDVYVFKSPDTKLGLFKVKSVNGSDAGTVEIAIKIQE